jgi:ribonuclease-3
MIGREEALEKCLGISFADGDLLSQALTHPSAVNEDPQAFSSSNQRLEFLGDAFIDFVVAQELYRRLPQMPEGELTELRSAIVRGETLAKVARDLSLGSFLHMGQGEEGSGGRERESNLAATLEAVIGALLLDRGSEAAYSLTLGLLQPELERTIHEGFAKDPKSRLQELAQGMGKGFPVYRTVAESGPDHLRTFTIEAVIAGQVMGTGSGRRKVEGERAAAQQALKALEEGA